MRAYTIVLTKGGVRVNSKFSILLRPEHSFLVFHPTLPFPNPGNRDLDC